MDELTGPAKGVAYPLTLGDSVLGKRQRQEYCTLRYDFKPGSFERFQPGAVHLQTTKDGTKVTVQLPNKSTGQNDLEFVGRYEQSKDDLECVAIFDGEHFRLELLAGTVKSLRHMRTVSKFSIPTGTSTYDRSTSRNGASPANARSSVVEDEEATDDEFEKDLTQELEGDDDDDKEEELATEALSPNPKRMKPIIAPGDQQKSPPVMQHLPQAPAQGASPKPEPQPMHSSDSSSSSSDSDSSSSDEDEDEVPQSVPEEGKKALTTNPKLGEQPPTQTAPQEQLDDHEREFLAGDDSDPHESSESSSSSSSDDEDLNRCSDDDSEGIGIEHF